MVGNHLCTTGSLYWRHAGYLINDSGYALIMHRGRQSEFAESLSGLREK